MRPLTCIRRWLRPRQALFGFLERRIRLDRRFKLAIVTTTLLMVVCIFRSFSWTYLASRAMEAWAGQTYRDSLHLLRTREEIDASWREFRRSGVEGTRTRVEKYYAKNDEKFRALMRYAGMDPEHGLLSWGNFNWIMHLSSKVFEPDEQLSYRLRPGVRSIWLTQRWGLKEERTFFLVPDGPDLEEIVNGTSMRVVEESRQLTNSWGLRGPEPDPDAPFRVLVLGDSFMQGMFIGDDDTPPECLRRFLSRERKTRVSVLNTGVMGYSPEQYYDSMERFIGRFRPHFVVVSLFANDCGGVAEAVDRGEGDWKEGCYWVEKITSVCEARGWPYVVVAEPFSPALLLQRRPGFYPGALANALGLAGASYMDPSEDFLDAHLKSRIEARKAGREPEGCTLFNDSLRDAHFSAAGAAVWAESVGRRLLLLLEDSQPAMPGKPAGAGPDRGGGKS